MNYYLAIAKRLKSEFEETENLLDISRSLALKYGKNEWKILVDIDRELAGIYIVRGKVSAANDILRRVKTVEEVLKDGGFETSAGCCIYNLPLR
jgi:hypothetical protein